MKFNVFDKRVVRRNIEKGLISQQDYLNHLASLEDQTEACVPVEEELYPKDEPEEENAEAAPPEMPVAEF